ncbi:helix-turn-helix domain-containing protein [Chitinophaga rhizosphaerae]|uniref:helix-turn-helix domain-containing protein n=1 Tax=Chitinophaga rhizosphaerae TaxID=1864947 RepID=UPI000F804CE7|nr:AraC family transcriptional regulator [Chitinophaga rhizosphaerae]
MQHTKPVLFNTGTYVGKETSQFVFEGVISSETRYGDHMVSDWHCHRNPHFSHILSGGSREVREDGAANQHAGAALYYYPGIAHQNVGYQEGTRIFNLEFTPAFFDKYGMDVPGESWMCAPEVQWNTSGLVQIMAEHYLNDQVSALSVHQLCLKLLAPAGTGDKTVHPGWTVRIRDLLYDSWDLPLSLTEISKTLDLHPVTVSKYFPRYFGLTIGDYLRKIKIEKALSMIRSGKHSLTEIAHHCGFSDQAHFIKTYKRFLGITPNQYRKL